jgi:hypothetical protein
VGLSLCPSVFRSTYFRSFITGGLDKIAVDFSLSASLSSSERDTPAMLAAANQRRRSSSLRNTDVMRILFFVKALSTFM